MSLNLNIEDTTPYLEKRNVYVEKQDITQFNDYINPQLFSAGVCDFAQTSTLFDINLYTPILLYEKKIYDKYKRDLFIYEVYGVVNYKLNRVIKTAIFKEGQYFFIESDEYNIYASGNSEREAKNEFSQHLVHFYEFYKDADPETLSNESKKLKELYADLLSTK